MKQFQQLAGRVDVIYHSGAALQYTASYQDLKPINVKGTQEVLRFACAGRRIKPVHYVSTLSVFPTYTADTPPMHEETSIEFGYDGLEGGYAQSKWVAERLIMQARKRGLPVTVYRPSRIVFHSHLGLWNQHDFLARATLGILQLGSVPDITGDYNLIPVDSVSRAIVELSRQPDTLGHTFHLTNSQPTSLEHWVAWLRSFGYSLRSLPYHAWYDELINQAQQNSELILASLLMWFPLPSEIKDRHVTYPGFKTVIENQQTMERLRRLGIEIPSVTERMLHRFLTFVQQKK
uniref:Thioester reductase (TE) domain-containing protein n=1 Tax=Thermosporothrix sp. COM3 TaxID=2490863 RepID=A0A455SPA3_9CHLR|nr:hypothetical protein KTC_27860 [Thermosporothrix sp. COM3]